MTRVKFTNRKGLTLTGDIEWPATGQYQAFALFAHCFTCTRNIKAAVNVTRALAASGIAVMRFDFTGLGQSEGDFSESHFSANLDDLEDAANFLGKEYIAPQLLIGHSLGGTAVLAVAPRIKSCTAVASINAPAEPEHVLHHLEDALEEIKNTGSAEVKLGGRPFRVQQNFVDDVRQFELSERLNSLKRALLVLHSPVDTIVAVENAQNIFLHARHPKSFVSLDQADHLLSRDEDSHYAGQIIASWAQPYLQPGASDASSDEHKQIPGLLAKGRTDQGFLTHLHSGKHHFLADEPVSYGGGDTSPGPYDYLAAALGACTTMTLNMYARHKKLPVSEVRCQVIHRRIHAEDCADCDKTSGKIDELSREIAISGDLSDAQRERMLEIADRCPVHRTLSNEIKIRTSALAEAADEEQG